MLRKGIKMKDRKQALLKKLEGFFKEDEDIEEASLFTKEELNAPMDVLRVFVTGYGPGLTDILAEYSFIPMPPQEVEEIWYFSTVITIETDIPKEGASALSNVISRFIANPTPLTVCTMPMPRDAKKSTAFCMFFTRSMSESELEI